MTPSSQARGRLVLVPAPLDQGAPGASSAPLVSEVFGTTVLQAAAELGYWVVEDAKSARAFLKRVDAVVPLKQPLQNVQIIELPRAVKGSSAPAPRVAPLLAPACEGHDMGLLSEAGLPAVADPGGALVLEAHRMGIPVAVLPGASALLLALAASGLNGQSFAFCGYLPNEPDERLRRVRELEAVSRRLHQTQLCIETPYRNAALLQALLRALAPSTWLSVSCGLTLSEAFTRTDRIQQWRDRPTTLPSDVPAVFVWLADRA